MVTVVTRVTLKEGSEPEWDAVMRERMENARVRAGWIRGQILMPLDSLSQRVIIGTWETRADWEAWHADESFVETRRQLEGMQTEPDETWWHEVLLDLESERDV
jgi:heme-degrading monooxygenase HmoA